MKKDLIRLGDSSLLLWKMIFALASFRIPMPVTELKVFPDCRGRPAYYVCPQCGLTMEREFMAFCDRCGQRLDWRSYRNAKIVYQRSHSRSAL